MRCNFVPAGVDFANQLGKTFGDPAEDEECCAYFRVMSIVRGPSSVVCPLLSVIGVEEVEEAVGVFFNTQFTGWPGGKRYVLFEVLHLEPVFYVDGQQDSLVAWVHLGR